MIHRTKEYGEQSYQLKGKGNWVVWNLSQPEMDVVSRGMYGYSEYVIRLNRVGLCL